MTTSMATADLQVSNRPFESNRDTASPNRNLTPVTTAVGPKGGLEVGGCGLSDLARQGVVRQILWGMSKKRPYLLGHQFDPVAINRSRAPVIYRMNLPFVAAVGRP